MHYINLLTYLLTYLAAYGNVLTGGTTTHWYGGAGAKVAGGRIAYNVNTISGRARQQLPP